MMGKSFIKQYNEVVKLVLQLPQKTPKYLIQNFLGSFDAEMMILKNYYANA